MGKITTTLIFIVTLCADSCATDSMMAGFMFGNKKHQSIFKKFNHS